MGCFFNCFKVRDDRHRPRSRNVSGAPVVARNQLSTLFISEESEDSTRKDSGSKSFGSPRYTKELKEEAKFLKACGTIVETPAEIRKPYRKLSCSSHDNINFEEEQGNESASAEPSPSSCTTSEQIPQRIEAYPIKGSESSKFITSAAALNSPDNVSTTCGSKSVRFKRDINESPGQNSSGSGREKVNGFKSSPYPTPLQLSDEMQTPGTVFPSNLDHGKPRIIRSEYVCSVKNAVESTDRLKALKEEVSTNDDYCKNFGGADRPIIGMVAAHWNEEEAAQISPKEWDGNGIPNSTHKYKEDQKVSWHATPFEERLEKALSEESTVTRKNFQGKPVAFDEEDNDTALSRLHQSSVQTSSVESYW